MQKYIYSSTDQIHCYEHFSQYTSKEYCELQHLVLDKQVFRLESMPKHLWLTVWIGLFKKLVTGPKTFSAVLISI